MKTLRKLALSLIGITIILSTLLYMGCEGDDDNVGDYFKDNPFQHTDRDSVANINDYDNSSTNIPPAPTPLSISPSSSAATPGRRIGVQAIGGTSPYSWSVGISAHGSIAPQSNSKYAVYTHTAAATDINNVIVTDSAGAVAIANIN